MNGAPPTRNEQLNRIDAIIRVVDQKGREMDQRWGIGRLPALVPIAVAEKFRLQQRKFSGAVWEYDPAQVTLHGEAMLRAYAKLEELALAAGADPTPPEQWEFDTPDGLVVLVRDIKDASRVVLDGRKAQVWSLDEIASIIRAQPAIGAAKDAFPGVMVESVRPAAGDRQMLNDELMFAPM